MLKLFHEEESGVTAIVSAVLMLSLMVSVMAIIQFSYVPEWKKMAEMDYTETTSQWMGQVKTSLESLVDNSLFHPELGGSASVSFRLGGGGLPIFDPRPSSGSLYIDPTGGWASIDYNSTFIPPVYNESVNTSAINRTILVRDIDGFNFTINSIGPNATAYMTLTITYEEDLPRYMRFWKDGLDLVYQVDTISESFGAFDMRVSGYFNNNQKPIDIINFFPGLMYRTGNTIVTTSISSGGSISSYWNISAVRLTGSPAGQSHITGGGEVEYSTNNYYYSDQRYIINGGGLVMVQGNQSVMYLPPAITIQAIDPTAIRIMVLSYNISCQPDSISGSGNVQISMFARPSAPSQLLVPAGYNNANNVSLNVSTQYENAWEVYLRSQAEAAGLNETLGQYNITTTPGYVNIRIEGKLSDTTQDIELEVVEGYIEVTLNSFT